MNGLPKILASEEKATTTTTKNVQFLGKSLG